MSEITLLGLGIIEQAKALAGQLAQLPDEEAIQVLNQVRQVLHEVSPFKGHPVDYVEWVPSEQVEANTYNPNRVAPPEMKLLETSIRENGYAMPLVVLDDKDDQAERGTKRIVDGENRGFIGKTSKAVRKQTRGYLPVSYIRPGRWELTSRMAATIQFNVHGEATVQGLSDLVLEFSRKGWSDERISKKLVMEPDKVLRLRQLVSLVDMFRDHTFSEAWTMVEMETLSSILGSPGIGLVACAQWEENSFVAEKVGVNQYTLTLNEEQVWAAEGEKRFVSAQAVEEEVQRHVPTYTIGAPIWYDGTHEPEERFIDEQLPIE